MKLPNLPSDGRPLALGLLLVVLVVLYFIAVHWWFVAPQLTISQQMDDLRDQHQRFAAIVAQRGEIRKRLAEVRKFERNNQAFLPQTDPSAASADLIQRVVDVVKKQDPDGKRCEMLQKQPFNQRSAEAEPYKKVSVRIRLRCDIEPLVGVLYDLESGKPYIFVDQMQVYRQSVFYRRGQKPPSKLEVQLTLSGYLHLAQPGTKT